MNICKISIIIPVFNCGEYIPECITSILNQTLEELEILFIDDNSTDNSEQIIKSYMKYDDRIKYFKSESNYGSGIARNMGLDNSIGEFVSFLDADDFYYENTTLEKLYLTALEKDVNIVGGNIQIFDTKLNIKTKVDWGGHFYNNNFLSFIDDYTYSLGYYRFLFSRRLLIKNEIYFPSYIRRQDPIFLVNVLLKNNTFYAINDYVYVYRIFHKTIEWNKKRIEDLLNAYKDIFELLILNNLIEHFRFDFKDFKIFVLEENHFIRTDEINKLIEKVINIIPYQFIKDKLQDHENEFINKILNKLNEYNKNDNFIIYGFGNVGIHLYERIKNRFNIVSIIDKNMGGLIVDNITVSSKLICDKDNIVILTILNEYQRKLILEKLYIDQVIY